jgi:hypothetical protein
LRVVVVVALVVVGAVLVAPLAARPFQQSAVQVRRVVWALVEVVAAQMAAELGPLVQAAQLAAQVVAQVGTEPPPVRP